MLNKNDKVPDIKIGDYEGNVHSLASLNKTILFFYPKDNTPGCTQQACNARDYYAEIVSLGWDIMGISPDSGKSHNSFASKLSLPYKLLSDTDRLAANSFGVIREKSLYGKLFKGVSRTTFAVDNGKILMVWENVSPKTHSQNVIEWIKIQ